jgi:hypothetical protein
VGGHTHTVKPCDGMSWKTLLATGMTSVARSPESTAASPEVASEPAMSVPSTMTPPAWSSTPRSSADTASSELAAALPKGGSPSAGAPSTAAGKRPVHCGWKRTTGFSLKKAN